jgi:hypothetical protein
MTKKHMKKCLPSLAIKEPQIKTTLSFHLIPIRLEPSRTQMTTNVDEDVVKMASSTVGGNRS